MKKIFTRIISLLFVIQVIAPPASAASLGLRAPDVEPPTIIFDASSTELEDGIQTFTATVTDNVGVANVTLYVKGQNDVAFAPKIMKQTSSDPTVYTANISVDSVISNKLEIYIRADDVSGNSIFEGQKFSPLTYTIVPKTVAKVVTPVTAPPKAEEEGMSTLTMILIGVGVLALAGGGGGGGGGDDEPSTGSITITTELPNE